MTRQKRGRLEVESPTPFPPDQLAQLRKDHQPGDDPELCGWCFRTWPCYTSRLLVMIPDTQDVVVHTAELLGISPSRLAWLIDGDNDD